MKAEEFVRLMVEEYLRGDKDYDYDESDCVIKIDELLNEIVDEASSFLFKSNPQDEVNKFIDWKGKVWNIQVVHDFCNYQYYPKKRDLNGGIEIWC